MPRFAVLILALLVSTAAHAQSGEDPAREAPDARGVVWAAPVDARAAALELVRIRAAGFDAVRTGPVTNERVLRTADSLGLALYQELPVEHASAAGLRAALPGARRMLDGLLARARKHPSARAFGLARRADTSDPAACAYFDTLTTRVRASGLPGARTYYVGAFVEADRCARSVDVVLLPTRDDAAPERRLERWARAHGTPVGLAAVGFRVQPGARGLRAVRSPEAQARAFETVFARADGLAAPLFVYRWRDGRAALADEPFDEHYGLLDAAGRSRPALRVVRGALVGEPALLSFEGGGREGRTPWLVLGFWLAVGLIALVYAVEPRVRALVPRYFRAHGFYREGVRDARDTLALQTLALTVAVALLTGVLWAALAAAFREQPAFEFAFAGLAGGVASAFAGLLARPGLLVLAVAVVHAGMMTLWAVLFYVAAPRRYLVGVWQALALIVWPRWTTLPLALAALLARTLPAERALDAALVVAGAWAACALWAMLRTLADFTLAARLPLLRTAALAFAHPLVLGALLVVFGTLDYGAEFAFLTHLATRS